MDPVQLRKDFENNGWVIIRDVFSEQEIAQMRENVQKSIENSIKGDLLSNPFLNSYLYEPRILDIARALLEGDVTYFGDSSILLYSKVVGWHKDNPDRYDQNGPDWSDKYNLIRVGIYLEDHENSSGGLLLRHKSQNTISIDFGKPLNVPVKKGDVAVWYLTTTHSGNAKLLRFFPKIIVNPKYYKILPDFIFKPEKIDRMALAFTFGKRGKHLDRYLKYLKSRQYGVSSWQNSIYDPETIAKAEKSGLEVMDMRKEVKDIDVKTLNLQHKDIPYQTV